MDKIMLLLMAMGVGTLLGIQGPINAKLGKIVGIFEGTLISASVGIITVSLVLFLGFGKGDLRLITKVPLLNFLGGVLGVMIVAGAMKVIPVIGVATAMSALIAGQMIAASLIDNFGWLGVQQRPLDMLRILGICFLFLGVRFIFR